MTLPKYIGLAGIIVVAAGLAYADGIASGDSTPFSQPQNIQSRMITNRPPTRVADCVEFDSSLRKLPRQVGPLVLRSESAHPRETGHEQQEQTSAILPESNTGLLLGIGLLLLLVIQRTILWSGKNRPVQNHG